MPELQIIGAPQSNYVWVARIACSREGRALHPCFRHCRIVRRSTRSIPFGKIPAMRHGDVTLAELRAICFYIDHAFDGPPLVPQDPVERRTHRAVDLASSTRMSIRWRSASISRAYLFPGTPDDSPDRARIDAALPGMESQFAMLDRAVANTGYLVGDTFTLADINLLPILYLP